jgi:hypothetical protein
VQATQGPAAGQRSMAGLPMESPAMDDFQHMGLIDDLLTE